MKATRRSRSLLARLARRYVAETLGLDLATFQPTDDPAWITLAKRLREQAAHGLAFKRRAISRGQVAVSK